MAQEWYYWRDSEILGPYTARQFAALAVSGELVVTDTVWMGNNEMGMPAHSIRNLFPATLATTTADSGPSEADAAAMIPPSAPPAEEAGAEGAVEPSSPVEYASTSRWDEVAHSTPVGRARATAGKGAMIVGQNGTTVKFRKKCTTCGFEDSSWKTIPIPRGTVRVSFYCPKCKRQRQVEIHGQMG